MTQPRDNGKLMMERTDFYRAMGLDYVVGETYEAITKKGNVIGSVIVSAASTIITKDLSTAYHAIIAAVTGVGSTMFTKEPGEYKIINTMTEVYNPAFRAYEVILTQEYYKQVYDNKGNPLWAIIDPENYVQTFYLGRFDASVFN